MDHHIASSEKEIRKYAADYITRNASRLSLITITGIETSSDGKRAILYISVLPEKAELIALDFLRRRQDEVRQHILKHAKIRQMPWLRFGLDKGEKNRQIVEELLQDANK